jgi:two-component system chemotaxis response regulator CheB
MPVRTRVVVVDDSALIRSLLKEIIDRQSDMECVGVASDPYVARETIRNTNPDVITLDVEMPRMDGIDFLGKLMRLRPTPVVMVSTLTERGADVTLRALELGAVDFVAKPKIGLAEGMRQLADDITDKIRIAARSQVRRATAAAPAGAGAPTAPVPSALGRLSTEKLIFIGASARATVRRLTAAPVATAADRGAGGSTPAPTSIGRLSTEKLIFIGASTGGTEATKEVLLGLPPDAPALLITQHMPPGFTASYAKRLDSLARISVKEAADGERVLPGHAYLAPGGFHLSVERSGANYIARVRDGEPVNRHKPSVEVLFESAARVVGPNAFGIMLTGMGADGAHAMRAMRDAGAYNFCQDEASCVVFGMPREAIAQGAANEVLPLARIAPQLLERLRTTAGVSINRV